MNSHHDDLRMLVGEGKSAFTEHVNYKFSEDSRALPFAGNTIICHIKRPSPLSLALAELQATLKGIPEAKYFSYLPAESFHMTLFVGVNDRERKPSHWPSNVDLDMSVTSVSQRFLETLKPQPFPQAFTLRPSHLQGAYSLRLTGFDEAEEGKLRQLRDQLASLLHHKLPDHDSYGFHITLAYLIRTMSITEAERVLRHSEKAFEVFTRNVDSIHLGAPELCEFQSMLHFKRLTYL